MIDQFSFQWIHVHAVKPFHSLLQTPNFEIVEAALPEARQPPIASDGDEIQMAAPVVANELVSLGNSDQSKPRPSQGENVGHPERQSPEKQNQFLSKDVQESYYSTVRPCQQKRAKGWATRANIVGNSEFQTALEHTYQAIGRKLP
jgi:hypothetical protein